MSYVYKKLGALPLSVEWQTVPVWILFALGGYFFSLLKMQVKSIERRFRLELNWIAWTLRR